MRRLRASCVPTRPFVATAALVAAGAACIAPTGVELPAHDADDVVFVANPTALAVVDEGPVVFEGDAWVGVIDGGAGLTPPLRGGYVVGGDGACPLPGRVTAYGLSPVTGRLEPIANQSAPWIQRPDVTGSVPEISSTCGNGREAWQLSGNACGFVVSSADPGWSGRALGLRRDPALPDPPQELVDLDGRCRALSAVPPAIASAECLTGRALCALDLFPPERPLAFTVSDSLTQLDGDKLTRLTGVLSPPFVSSLKGLALHDDRLYVLASGADDKVAVDTLDPSCVERATLRSLDPATLDEGPRLALPPPYDCGVTVFARTSTSPLYVLARRATPEAVDCRQESTTRSQARAWAVLRLEASGQLALVAELGAPCAARALLGRRDRETEPWLVGLVQDALASTGRPGETWLTRFDTERGRVVGSSTVAGVELGVLLPTSSPWSWLSFDRGGGSFIALGVSERAFVVDYPPILAPIVLGNSTPRGFTRFASGHVAAWFDRRGGGVAAWITDQRADRETSVIVVGASWSAQDVGVIVPDWPRVRAGDTGLGVGLTIATAADPSRAVTLRGFERLSSQRARHRPVAATVGRGGVDPSVVVLRDGTLFVVLATDGRVVRVEAPR